MPRTPQEKGGGSTGGKGQRGVKQVRGDCPGWRRARHTARQLSPSGWRQGTQKVTGSDPHFTDSASGHPCLLFTPQSWSLGLHSPQIMQMVKASLHSECGANPENRPPTSSHGGPLGPDIGSSALGHFGGPALPSSNCDPSSGSWPILEA